MSVEAEIEHTDPAGRQAGHGRSTSRVAMASAFHRAVRRCSMPPRGETVLDLVDRCFASEHVVTMPVAARSCHIVKDETAGFDRSKPTWRGCQPQAPIYDYLPIAHQIAITIAVQQTATMGTNFRRDGLSRHSGNLPHVSPAISTPITRAAPSSVYWPAASVAVATTRTPQQAHRPAEIARRSRPTPELTSPRQPGCRDTSRRAPPPHLRIPAAHQRCTR